MTRGHASPALLRPSTLAVYVLGSVLAAAAALWFQGGTSSAEYFRLQLPPLSLFATLQAIVVGVTVLVARRQDAGLRPLDLICFAAVALYFLGIVTEYPGRTWDWRAYEQAAVAAASGDNPYEEADYLYPPPFAQIGGGAVRIARSLGQVEPAACRASLFLLWQSLQFHAVLLCYLLARRFLHRVELAGWQGTAGLAALFVLSTPMLRAVRFSQPALYTLGAALVVVLWSDRHPVLAGLSIAVAGYLKVYPAVLLLPALVTGRKRVVGWTVAWVAVIGAASFAAPGGREYWFSFLQLLRSFPEPLAFRDNSVPGLVRNTARVLLIGPPSLWAARLIQIGLALWLVRRMIVRGTRRGCADASVWHGNVADALCLGLLLSPTVWEHYFVFVVPAIVLVWRTSLRERPITVGLATALTSLVPVFDVFPLSYHRLAGLVLLVAANPLWAEDRPTGSRGAARGS